MAGLHDQALVSNVLVKAKTVVDAVIYEKVMRVSRCAAKDSLSEAKIQSLVTRDTAYIRRLLNEITTYIWTTVNIVGVFSFFISTFGWCFPAILLIVFGVRKLEERIERAKYQEIHEQRQNEDTQQALMTEMFSNIKFLKLYGWTHLFTDRCKSVHDEEVRLAR